MGSHFYSPQQISYLVAANGLHATIAHDEDVTAWVIVDKPERLDLSPRKGPI